MYSTGYLCLLFTSVSLFLCSVNLALGLMANDPVRIALTFTYLQFFFCQEINHLEKTLWKFEIAKCNPCLNMISSVKVGGSPGCRRLRPICPQADEPERKPRPLRQYDSAHLQFSVVAVPTCHCTVPDVNPFALCAPDNLMLPLTNYGVPW